MLVALVSNLVDILMNKKLETSSMRKIALLATLLASAAVVCGSAGLPEGAVTVVRPPGMALAGRHIRFPVQVRSSDA